MDRKIVFTCISLGLLVTAMVTSNKSTKIKHATLPLMLAAIVSAVMIEIG